MMKEQETAYPYPNRRCFDEWFEHILSKQKPSRYLIDMLWLAYRMGFDEGVYRVEAKRSKGPSSRAPK